ncbi:MAG: D-alanyl-D-alanine carboxypeptidase/D-alanyl-D-alanine-endopeptidase (penicillin-binding protein 4), partial [Ancylomarina sp.]
MTKSFTRITMTRFTLNLSFIGYLLLVCFTASAQKQSEQKFIDAFSQDELFKSASIGMEVCDLKTGEILAEHQSEKSLTPASTQKLITTAAALEILGSNFQFKTDVYITGRIDKDGNLMGNLIIRGFGDPTLGSKYFPQNNRFISTVYDELKKLGIRQING